MKKGLFRLSLLILFCAFSLLLGLHVWIRSDVNENITQAKATYAGTSEDVLIAFLRDESNRPVDRTQVAIWTLGRLHSEKALPVLRSYYKNDPEGITCFGKHDSVLCQYEIYKAITSIERNRLITFSGLK